MIDVLTEFYTVHYNFGLIAVLMLLLAAFMGSRKNIRGVVVILCVCVVYNLILYNKTKRDPEWYEKQEAEVKGYDPVKKLWENKPADDDVNKRK